MPFDDLETKYFCEHKYFEDMLEVNPWVKYRNAGCKLSVIRQSFDEIKRSYASTSEVYIEKERQYLAACKAERIAFDGYCKLDRIEYFEACDILECVKYYYNRAVKLRIKEMFPVNLEKKLKQIAFERRLHAIKAWAAARVPRRKA
uniref:Uncharacterized protein n=1 Tax=viral metagenome TaxID=1070528 RepID=A0A6C0JYG6_9ZZZZ